MQRREFMGLVAGASVWPLAARAQLVPPAEVARPTIAFLNDLSSDEWPPAMDAMRLALNAAGFVEGHNVAFAYRWTEGHRESLPTLAANVVRDRPAVIVASGHIAAAMAARAATSDIPVVFVTSDDPVKFGLVSSLERPGASATGTYLAKPADDPTTRQGLLRQIMPGTMVFFTLNINDSTNMAWDRDPGKTIAGLFATTRSFNINTHAAIPTPRSLTITSGPFLDHRRREDLLSLVTSLGVPALYDWRSFTDSGGLMSYGASLADVYARTGDYIARILNGQAPADLPVLKPSRFELVVNLRTAAALGIKMPAALLDNADELIL